MYHLQFPKEGGKAQHAGPHEEAPGSGNRRNKNKVGAKSLFSFFLSFLVSFVVRNGKAKAGGL